MTVDTAQTRILVVDDEPNIADLLSAALTFEGYQVGVAATGAEALEQVRSFRPNLVMLDVMLPDFDGNEVCRRLRNQGEQMPIVFLTARDTTQDKVEGLSMGDDYVTKPFSIEELMARVGAILRRAGEVAAADTSTLQFADLTMNIDTHEVWRDEQTDRPHRHRVQPVALPARERAPRDFEVGTARQRLGLRLPR